MSLLSQGFAGGVLPGVIAKTTGGVPAKALTFADSTPLQFSDGQYLETAA